MLKWKMDCGMLPVAVRKNKRTKVAKWINLRNAADKDDDKPHPEWTEYMEAELQQINNKELTLKDTAVGQEKKKGVNDKFSMILADSPTIKQ